MKNMEAVIDRVARKVMGSGDMMVETFGSYVRITGMISTGRAILEGYMRDLAKVELEVNKEVVRVIDWAKRQGIRAVKRNIGINPREGEVGCVVEFNRFVGPDEYKTLGK